MSLCVPGEMPGSPHVRLKTSDQLDHWCHNRLRLQGFLEKVDKRSCQSVTTQILLNVLNFMPMFFCAIGFGSGNWFREIPSSSSRQVPWSAASTNRIMCPTAKTTRVYTSESKEDLFGMENKGRHNNDVFCPEKNSGR